MEGQMRRTVSRFSISVALSAGLMALVSMPLFSAPNPAAKQEAPAKQEKANAPSQADAQNTGAQKFKQNCSRCHKAPEGFSSSISGTVLKHMRARASLSAQDERDILRFLNP
jgi:mono/diheme cytochrome c family protein